MFTQIPRLPQQNMVLDPLNPVMTPVPGKTMMDYKRIGLTDKNWLVSPLYLSTFQLASWM